MALVTRNVVVSKNTFSFVEVCDSFPSPFDCAADLVTEDSSGAVAAVSLLDVCSADSRCRQFDEDFAWSRARDWNVFDSDLALGIDKAGLHEVAGCICMI